MEQNLTLDDAVRRWQALREQGKTAAVGDLCSDCPGIEAELSERLRAVASMAAFLGFADGNERPDAGGRRPQWGRDEPPTPRRDDAPRDLLLGLLALQNGLVSRDQLAAAVAAWTGTPGRALAQLLVEQGALDTD
jgi:hypothetical protein